MSEQIGIPTPAIVRPRVSAPLAGHDPVEITSGELFRVEIDDVDELGLTHIEHLWGEGYFSIDGYPLREGMRAAIGCGE